MSQFQIEKKSEGDKILIEIKGHIDEDANFSNVDLSSGGKFIFDLQNVEAINSCGIREWITWVRKAPPASELVFRNCPKIVVDQINMVAGFLPDNGRIESFYVPYFCESSGNEKMILFTEGKEFKGSDLLPPEEIKDDETGEFMEMDVIEAKYFKFLKK